MRTPYRCTTNWGDDSFAYGFGKGVAFSIPYSAVKYPGATLFIIGLGIALGIKLIGSIAVIVVFGFPIYCLYLSFKECFVRLKSLKEKKPKGIEGIDWLSDEELAERTR